MIGKLDFPFQASPSTENSFSILNIVLLPPPPPPPPHRRCCTFGCVCTTYAVLMAFAWRSFPFHTWLVGHFNLTFGENTIFSVSLFLYCIQTILSLLSICFACTEIRYHATFPIYCMHVWNLTITRPH